MKKKKFTLLLFLSLVVFFICVIPWDKDSFFNQTIAEDNIEEFNEQVVWTKADGPININGKDLYFNQGLIVEKGVIVLMKNKSRLIIKEKFEVLGSNKEPVIFRGIDKEEENFSITVNQAEKTYINNAKFQRGGFSGCLAFNNKNDFLKSALAENCLPNAALNIIYTEELTINSSFFEENYRAINIKKSDVSVLTNNTFLNNGTENQDVSIYSETEKVVNLKSNCWMRPSGPTHESNPKGRGEKIEGNFKIEFHQECGSEFKPVILIPGIGGSWNWEVMMENKVASNSWNFAPVTHFYDSWEDSLQYLGYEKDRDYFITFYDWRKDNHGNVEDFLKPTLEKIREISFDSKYDIIAHSMGGFLTLDYLMGDQYDDNINKVVLQGSPLAGASKAYPVWSGGVIPENWSVLEHYLSSLSWKEENENLDNYDLIHKYVPSAKQLLPIYDYIKKNENGEKVSFSNMNDQNDYLWDLMMKIGQNQNSFNFENLLMIQGSGQQTSDVITVDEYSGENSEKLWLDGQPNPYPLKKTNLKGDGTVLNVSSEMPFFETITLDEVSHSDLPTKAIQKTGEFLEIDFEEKEYPLNFKEKLLMIFACPIDVKIYDSEGNYVDKNQVTIDDAYYYSDGKEDGYKIIEIQNPKSQEYSIEITGNGEGKYNSIIYNYLESDSYSKEFSGVIKENEKISYDITLASENILIEKNINDNNKNNANDEERSDDNDDEDEKENEEDEDKKFKKNKKEDKILGYVKNQEKKEELNPKQNKDKIVSGSQINASSSENEKDQIKIAGEKNEKSSPLIIFSLILIGGIALLLTWTIGKENNFIKKYFR